MMVEFCLWSVVGVCIQALVNLVHILQMFVIVIYVKAVSYALSFVMDYQSSWIKILKRIVSTISYTQLPCLEYNIEIQKLALEVTVPFCLYVAITYVAQQYRNSLHSSLLL